MTEAVINPLYYMCEMLRSTTAQRFLHYCASCRREILDYCSSRPSGALKPCSAFDCFKRHTHYEVMSEIIFEGFISLARIRIKVRGCHAPPTPAGSAAVQSSSAVWSVFMVKARPALPVVHQGFYGKHEQLLLPNTSALIWRETVKSAAFHPPCFSSEEPQPTSWVTLPAALGSEPVKHRIDSKKWINKRQKVGVRQVWVEWRKAAWQNRAFHFI